MFIDRSIYSKIKKNLEFSPVTLLIGPRQSGKTTPVQRCVKKQNYTYITFDDISYLAQAKKDPHGFIMSLPKPVIIDEIQRAPERFLSIKYDVDRNRVPGRYLVAGSANALKLPSLGDSMADRLNIIKLYPFSVGEKLGIVENFIESIFTRRIGKLSIAQLSKADLYDIFFVGGYSIVQHMDTETRFDWFESYCTILIVRDIKDFVTMRGIVEFPQLLKLIGQRVSTLLNTAELSRASKIPGKFMTSIILYCGTDVRPYGEDMYALPIPSLWSTFRQYMFINLCLRIPEIRVHWELSSTKFYNNKGHCACRT